MDYFGAIRFSEEAKIRIAYNSDTKEFLIIVVDDENEKVYGYEGTVTEGS